MVNPVKLKRSNVPSKVPTIAQLLVGELGMNTADRRVFFSTGDIVKALANVDDLTFSNLSGKPSTLSGYGITDAYTKSVIDSALAAKANSATTLAGYGIIDAAPLSHVSDTALHLTASQNTWLDSISATSAEVNFLSGVTSSVQTQLNGKQATLGFTPENVANKGVANGYVPLGADTKIAATYLPSFVDDVVEYANLAGFPATGETGKIYTALDTNKIYRWSGSVYVEISGSPGSTDAVPEGAANLYFTAARAQAAVTSVTGNAGTATKLATARNIAITGDVSWNVNFDGSANATAVGTLTNTGVTAGTYGSATKIVPYTVDAKGRVTSVGAATTITPAWGSVTGKPTTIGGFGITDAQALNTFLTSLSGLGTAKGLVVDNAGVATAVTLTGTANQVAVTNGDGTAGNPTIALVNDATLPGTGGINVPAGPTAQRKVGADGAIRYSTTSPGFEGLVAGVWENFVTGTADLAAIQLRRTTTLALTTTQTDITFDTVDYANDTTALSRGTTTSQLVCRRAGLYAVTFDCENINTTNANIDYFQIKQNGVAVARGLISVNSRSTRLHNTKTVFLYMNAGDYVSVAAYSSTGTSGTLQIGAALSAFSMQGNQGVAGIAGGQSTMYFAATNFDNPNNANWAVNALAPVVSDTANASLSVRAFDDTAEEGIGCTVYIPPSVSNITFKITGKAATAPTGSASAIMRVYGRAIPSGAAVGAWSSSSQMTSLDMSTNVYYQDFTRTVSLASLGLTAGTNAQLEITRYGASAADTLIGDFQILSATVSFS